MGMKLFPLFGRRFLRIKDTAPAAAPTATITSVLQTMVDTLVPAWEAAGLAALAAVPGLGWLSAFLAGVLKIPLIGNAVQQAFIWSLNWGIAQGVIDLKVVLLNFLTDEAKIKYAPQLALIQQLQAATTITPEQQAAFDQAFQNIVKNNPGVVNA